MGDCVHVFIQNKLGQYLLQFRDDRSENPLQLMWGSFGGGREDGERVLYCAARETHEELGLDCLEDDFELLDSFKKSDGEVMRHVVLFRFSVEWAEFKVYEGAGAGFFSKDSALKLHLTPGTREVFERCL